ncbi:hypothetical protein X566_08395 [Afipia sp. P52-10]|jgi:hypothetical protein|uniref:hypothetical protein n=1 Tax=Afipia sp. P52-10 TaxID=1429916 RepID=UPI0003DEFB9E|nr:hypothetical protein [Afipia sp. P52-10]ETR79029.1 hypothetical protein X566_08395 [Afipia sp. P52-10]
MVCGLENERELTGVNSKVARGGKRPRHSRRKQRGGGQPSEETPGQAAVVIEDDTHAPRTGEDGAIWNHSTFYHSGWFPDN